MQNDKKDLITIQLASKYLGVSKDTLRRWEKKKIIKPYRSPSGWRYYDKHQLDYVFNQKPDLDTITNSLKNSSHAAIEAIQKPVVKASSVLPKPEAKKESINWILLILIFIFSLTASIIIFYCLKSLTR